MIKNQSAGKKFRKVFAFGALLTLGLSTMLTTTNALAGTDNSNFPKPVALSGDTQSNVVNNAAQNQYNASATLGKDYTKSTTAIGFDALYGAKRDLFIYNGEASRAAFVDDKGKIKNEEGLRMLDITEIAGMQRTFSTTKKDAKPDYQKATDRKEFHWYGMLGSDRSSHTFIKMFSGVNNFFAGITKFMIQVSGFDLSVLNSTIDKSGLGNSIAEIFLFSNEGTISPLFVVAVVGFLLGMIALGARYVKGRVALKEILQEFAALMLATFVAMLVAGGNGSSNMSKLTSAGLNIGNAFAVQIGTAANNNLKVYETLLNDKNDKGKSAILTQQSMINSMYINAWIEAEFGMPVEKLDLYSGTFGSKSEVDSAIAAIAKTKDGKKPYYNNGELFKIYTAKTDANGGWTNNLGMYLWAANSNVATKATPKEANPFYWDNSAKEMVARTDKSLGKGEEVGYDYTRTLFVIDFLQEINKTTKSATVRNNVQTIINHLKHPNTGTLGMQIGIMILINLATIWAAASILILTMVGKIIVVLGVYMLVLFPMLMLIPSARGMLKQMGTSYLMGFIRFTVGSAAFNILFAMVSVFTQQGTGGMIIALVIALMMGKFGPKLIRELNARLNIVANRMGGELAFAQKMNQAMFNMRDKSLNIDGNRKVYDHDGNEINKRDASRTRNIAKAIQQGKGFRGVLHDGIHKYGKDPRLINKNADFGDEYQDDLVNKPTADADLFEREQVISRTEQLQRDIENASNGNSNQTRNTNEGFGSMFRDPNAKTFDERMQEHKRNSDFAKRLGNSDGKLDGFDSNQSNIGSHSSHDEADKRAVERTAMKLAGAATTAGVVGKLQQNAKFTKNGKQAWAPIRRAKYYKATNGSGLRKRDLIKGIAKDSVVGLYHSDIYNRKATATKNLVSTLAFGAAIKTVSYVPGIGEKAARTLTVAESATKQRQARNRKNFEAITRKLADEGKATDEQTIVRRKAEDSMFMGMTDEQRERAKSAKGYKKKLRKAEKKATREFRSIKAYERAQIKENVFKGKGHIEGPTTKSIDENIRRTEEAVISMPKGPQKKQAEKELQQIKSIRDEKIQSKPNKLSMAQAKSNLQRRESNVKTNRPDELKFGSKATNVPNAKEPQPKSVKLNKSQPKPPRETVGKPQVPKANSKPKVEHSFDSETRRKPSIEQRKVKDSIRHTNRDR